MAFTTINLTESVPAEELAVYGAKPGQHDCFPGGIAVFGVASADTSAGTAYITAAGALSGTSASGSITVKILAACKKGDGIYGVACGIVPASTPVAMAYTVVA